MGLFKKSDEERQAQAAARLPKLEARRVRAQEELAIVELRYHKVNSGRGVGAVVAEFTRGGQQQRRDSAAQEVDSLRSGLEVLDHQIARVRAEAGLPPETPGDGPHAVPAPGL